MIGCRALQQNEIDLIMMNLKGLRERALFSLMLYTGFRISEALSLKVSDVLQDRVTVQRRNMKGKVSSRSIILHSVAKYHLQNLITFEKLNSNDCLFASQKGGAIKRVQAWKLFKAAVKASGLEGKIALHSPRKTFAEKMHTHFKNDIVKTSKALGHKNIMSTVSYLSFKTEELDEAILKL